MTRTFRPTDRNQSEQVRIQTLQVYYQNTAKEKQVKLCREARKTRCPVPEIRCVGVLIRKF